MARRYFLKAMHTWFTRSFIDGDDGSAKYVNDNHGCGVVKTNVTHMTNTELVDVVACPTHPSGDWLCITESDMHNTNKHV